MPREPAPLLGTSYFRVLIGRREVGFCEVGRLTSHTELAPVADERRHIFETVVLRRALTGSTDLYDWRRRIAAGSDDRRPVTIQQLESSGGRIANSWRLEGAWPCRWSGPAFDSLASGVAYEEVELAFDELVWEAEPAKPAPRSSSPTQGA